MRDSSFFSGVEQVETTMLGHDIKLPIFYYEGVAITAAFPAKLSGLRKLLPDSRFVPARVAPGVGVVAIACFEYLDTDIGPYNELAITIPLNEPYFRANLPLRALAESQLTGRVHAYVKHLPVTTEIARVGGVEFYNYPKFVAGIDFAESGNQRTCVLTEGSDHILTVTADKPSVGKPRPFQLFSHLWMDRQPQSSEFKINAIGSGMTQRPGTARVELGEHHPIARSLSDVLISRRSITVQYMPSFEGILYGPEHLSVQFLHRALASAADSADVTTARAS